MREWTRREDESGQGVTVGALVWGDEGGVVEAPSKASEHGRHASWCLLITPVDRCRKVLTYVFYEI